MSNNIAKGKACTAAIPAKYPLRTRTVVTIATAINPPIAIFLILLMRVKIRWMPIKKPGNHLVKSGFYFQEGMIYIMPSIPPPPIGGIAGFSSLISESTHSVVRSIPAIDAAFSKATRATLVGSITPASYNFS